MNLQTRPACHVHVELINRKLDKLNALNVPTFPGELESQSDQAHVQLVTVRNVAQLANISTRKLVSADHAVTDSFNPMKAHSTAKFADLDKRQDQLKRNRVENAAMNAHQECNLELMANVSHVHEELSAPREFNQHVTHVH
jgi:hypothetical protein